MHRTEQIRLYFSSSSVLLDSYIGKTIFTIIEGLYTQKLNDFSFLNVMLESGEWELSGENKET